MVDKVKPLKIEDGTNGTEIDMAPVELNPTEDYVATKGIALENLDTILIDASGGEIQFTDTVTGTKQLSDLLDAEQENFDPTGSDLISTKSGPAIREASQAAVVALETPRFTIPLIYNGTVSNNEFIGYSNLLPGDSTPIIIPTDSILQEYTFSNSNAGADYTIELRKNTTVGTAFLSTPKTNTQFFVEANINQSFAQGDRIYIKYIDSGTNASDVAIVLVFQATP